MITDLPVGLILILGAALVPFLRGNVRAAYMLLLPVVTFAWLLALPYGEFSHFELFGQTLTAMRVDRLSLLFGYVFLIAILVSTIYALKVADTAHHIHGLSGRIGKIPIQSLAPRNKRTCFAATHGNDLIRLHLPCRLIQKPGFAKSHIDSLFCHGFDHIRIDLPGRFTAG